MNRNRLAACLFALLCTLAFSTSRLHAAQPGVGLPIPSFIPADWQKTWCPEKRIKPGQTFTPIAVVVERGWDWQRHCPSHWKGRYAEMHQHTEEALYGAWLANHWGTRASHNGRRTELEKDYASVYWDWNSELYRKYWWERTFIGGSSERPIVVSPENLDSYNDAGGLIECTTKQSAWPMYGETKSFQPCDGGSWTAWVRNQVPPGYQLPATGDAIEVLVLGKWEPDRVKAVSGQWVNTQAHGRQAIIEEGSLWRRSAGATTPTPVPTPPISTPTPLPTPDPIPALETPTLCPPAIVLPTECAPIAAVRETADVIARNAFTAQRRRQRVADCIKAIERTFAQ